MDDDLFELYSTGKNRKYREIARNPELKGGFARAVRTMMSVDTVDQLSAFSFLHYEHLKHQLAGLSSGPTFKPVCASVDLRGGRWRGCG